MARSNRKPAASERSVRIDFKEVGASRFTPPEGEYLVEISKLGNSESSNGNPQLEMDLSVIDGKHKGKQFREWFSLLPQALWRLAGVLRSAGVDIPEEVVDLDFEDIEGRKLIVVVGHRETDNGVKAQVTDSASIEGSDDEAEDEAEEETPPPKKAASKKAPKEEEPEPVKKSSKKATRLPQLSEDEVDEMDESELEDVVEKYSLDVELGDHKTLRKKAKAVKDALGDYLED